MKQVLHHMTVKYVRDGHVVCSGWFPAAETRDRITGAKHPPALHNLLEPVIHLTDLDTPHEVKVGDLIIRYDDGSHEHKPK